MDVEQIKSRIDEIDRIGNSAWIASLEPRKKAELDFHNRDRDRSFIEKAKTSDTFDKFYGTRNTIRRRHAQEIT